MVVLTILGGDSTTRESTFIQILRETQQALLVNLNAITRIRRFGLCTFPPAAHPSTLPPLPTCPFTPLPSLPLISTLPLTNLTSSKIPLGMVFYVLAANAEFLVGLEGLFDSFCSQMCAFFVFEYYKSY